MTQSRTYKRSRFSRLTCSYIILFTGLTCILVGIPITSKIITDYGKDAVIALEQTAAWLNGGVPVNASSIQVTPELTEYAANLGVSEEDLKIYIAAAYSQNIRPWHILGFAQIESSFCANIGGGVAIDEVQARLATAPLTAKAWWAANVTALQLLAVQLGVDIREIPGSIGAGAISCMQLMPINWMKYGGGDYKDLFTAGNHAGGYLNDTGYKTSFEEAVGRYNPGGGQAYVNKVVEAADNWESHYTGVTKDQELDITEKPVVSPLLVLTVWMEFFRNNMYRTTAGPVPVIDGFAHPFPTFTGYGYRFGSPVYVGGVKVIDHPGVDLIGPSGDPIYAAHEGRVTYAEYLSRFLPLAARWWISGNVVVIRGDLNDGTPLCSFYGHGLDRSISVTVGEKVGAGTQIMQNGNTGFSSAPHLHFSVKVGGDGDFCDGGTWVNPEEILKKQEVIHE